jgi:hypothetical protein
MADKSIDFTDPKILEIIRDADVIGDLEVLKQLSSVSVVQADVIRDLTHTIFDKLNDAFKEAGGFDKTFTSMEYAARGGMNYMIDTLRVAGSNVVEGDYELNINELSEALGVTTPADRPSPPADKPKSFEEAQNMMFYGTTQGIKPAP